MSTADRDKWNTRYREGAYEARQHPSAYLVERSTTFELKAGRAMDVACGSGRNSLYLAERGFSVDAVDISEVGLAKLAERARGLDVCTHVLDLEHETPLPGAEFALIILMRYVDLALTTRLLAQLERRGSLLVEEHLQTDASVSGPRAARFRVAPGALFDAVAGVPDVDVVDRFEGLVDEPDGSRAALARVHCVRH